MSYSYDRITAGTATPVKPELVPAVKRAIQAAEAEKVALEGILSAFAQFERTHKVVRNDMTSAGKAILNEMGLDWFSDEIGDFAQEALTHGISLADFQFGIDIQHKIKRVESIIHNLKDILP